MGLSMSPLTLGIGGNGLAGGASDEYALPDTLPTPMLWYNVAKGGDGETLTDFGSLGVDATQSTADNRPTVNATGLNSRPTLDFDGVDDGMVTPSIDLTGTQQITELLVWYPNVSVTDGFVTCFGTNSIASGSYAVAQNIVAADDIFVTAKSTIGSARNAGYFAAAQAARIVAVKRDLTETDRALELKLYVDGVQETVTMISGGEAGSGTFANTMLSLGAQGVGGSPNSFANIKLAEMVLFDALLTDEQIAAWATSRQALYVA